MGKGGVKKVENVCQLTERLTDISKDSDLGLDCGELIDELHQMMDGEHDGQEQACEEINQLKSELMGNYEMSDETKPKEPKMKQKDMDM